LILINLLRCGEFAVLQHSVTRRALYLNQTQPISGDLVSNHWKHFFQWLEKD